MRTSSTRSSAGRRCAHANTVSIAIEALLSPSESSVVRTVRQLCSTAESAPVSEGATAGAGAPSTPAGRATPPLTGTGAAGGEDTEIEWGRIDPDPSSRHSRHESCGCCSTLSGPVEAALVAASGRSRGEREEIVAGVRD